MIRYVEVFVPKQLTSRPQDGQPKMICADAECNFATCFTCKVPWHEGQTCSQYQSLLHDGKSADYIRMYCKKCPRSGCGAPSTKYKRCHELVCANGRPPQYLTWIGMIANLT
jgi:IBR domain, a half RING-finger domain